MKYPWNLLNYEILANEVRVTVEETAQSCKILQRIERFSYGEMRIYFGVQGAAAVESLTLTVLNASSTRKQFFCLTNDSRQPL